MHTTATLQPTLPISVHVAGVLGALAIIVGTVSFADRASEDAVMNAQAAISPGVMHVMLPTVEVIGRRSGEPVADAVACPAPVAHKT